MQMFRVLRPSKQRKNKKKIFGFDIETAGNKNKFVMASIWASDDEYYIYYDKKSLIDDLTTPKFQDSIICATNLSFDFFGVMFGKASKYFNFIFRGSDLIFAKTYSYNNKLNKKSNHHNIP